jgi:hypothetical protein
MDKEPDIKLTEKDFEGQSLLVNSNSFQIIWNHKWQWDMFGGGELVVKLAQDVTLWRRIITRILLGSKWKRL